MADEQVLGSVTLDDQGNWQSSADAIASQLQPGDLARLRLDFPFAIDWIPGLTALVWTVAQVEVQVTDVRLEGSNTLIVEWRV